jgi:hypothetical protein
MLPPLLLRRATLAEQHADCHFSRPEQTDAWFRPKDTERRTMMARWLTTILRCTVAQLRDDTGLFAQVGTILPPADYKRLVR